MTRTIAALDNYWGGLAEIIYLVVEQLDKAQFRKEYTYNPSTCNLLSNFDTLTFSENKERNYLIIRHEVDDEEWKTLLEHGPGDDQKNRETFQPFLASKVQETLHIAPSLLKKYIFILKIDHGCLDLTEFYLWQTGNEGELEEELNAEDQETDEDMELISAPFEKYHEFPAESEGKTIKEYAIERGLEFKHGRGYYEFTKPEKISKGKRILLKQQETGEIYDGDIARKIAGIPQNAERKVDPTELPKYRVFVQSTSSTRILQSGTLFIYEAGNDKLENNND